MSQIPAYIMYVNKPLDVWFYFMAQSKAAWRTRVWQPLEMSQHPIILKIPNIICLVMRSYTGRAKKDAN